MNLLEFPENPYADWSRDQLLQGMKQCKADMKKFPKLANAYSLDLAKMQRELETRKNENTQ